MNEPASYAADRFRLVFLKKRKAADVKPLFTAADLLKDQLSQESNGKAVNNDVSIKADESKTGFSIHPNPVTGRRVQLVCKDLPEGNYKVVLTGENGFVLSLPALIITNGAAVKELQLPGNLLPGVYQVIISNGNTKLYNKLILL